MKRLLMGKRSRRRGLRILLVVAVLAVLAILTVPAVAASAGPTDLEIAPLDEDAVQPVVIYLPPGGACSGIGAFFVCPLYVSWNS